MVFYVTFRFLVGNGTLWYFMVLSGFGTGTFWYFMVLFSENYTLARKELLLFRTSKLLNWDFVEIFGTLANTELRFSGIKWYFNK